MKVSMLILEIGNLRKLRGNEDIHLMTSSHPLNLSKLIIFENSIVNILFI